MNSKDRDEDEDEDEDEEDEKDTGKYDAPITCQTQLYLITT